MLVYYKKTGQYHSVKKVLKTGQYVIYTDNKLTDTVTASPNQIVVKD